MITLACLGQAVLTNDAILKMTKAGLSEEIILGSIKAQPGQFSTAPDDLIALKSAGVSDKVIAGLLEKSAGAAPRQIHGCAAGSRGARHGSRRLL